MTIYANNTDYVTADVIKVMEENDIYAGEYFCPVCGKEESDWSGECPICKNKLVYVCEECKELNYMNESEREDTCGLIICENCFYDLYQCCDRCECVVNQDDITTVTVDRRGNTEYWCEDCLSNHATQCEHCNDYYADELVYEVENSMRDNTINICCNCYEGSCDVCENCDEVVYNAICYNEDYLCRNCYEERLAEEEMNDEDSDRGNCTEYPRRTYQKIIYGYHCYPSFHRLNFIEDKNQNYFRDENLHLGIELEMENRENDSMAKEIIEASGYEYRDDMFVVMHDGSLTNGFEVISQPATYEAHINKLNWEKVLGKARRLGFNSHNGGRCGLHFHFDREYFPDNLTIKTEAKFIVLLTNNREWLKVFSRRKDFRYCEFNVNKDFTENDDLNDVLERKYLFKGHNTCLNLGNNYEDKKTIELRFIRGTLIYETFLAALQLMVLIGKIIKTHSFEEIKQIRLNDFVVLAQTYQFKEFTAYLKKKELIEVDPFDEVIETEVVEERQSA